MGPTWGPPGSCRPQMGPVLAPWTLLSGKSSFAVNNSSKTPTLPGNIGQIIVRCVYATGSYFPRIQITKDIETLLLMNNQFLIVSKIYGILWQLAWIEYLQYIPRNMHTVFALLCFVVVIHWLIFPYPLGLLHWHCGNLTIAPVPAKQPWWIWINTSCEFIMNDCITTTKQSTTKPCAYFLGYTVWSEWS